MSVIDRHLHPWRVAVAALAAAGASETIAELPFASMVDADHLEQVQQLAASSHWPKASGAGRLFEAAGAVFGLVTRNDWEGEAAARFERLRELRLKLAREAEVPPYVVFHDRDDGIQLLILSESGQRYAQSDDGGQQQPGHEEVERLQPAPVRQQGLDLLAENRPAAYGRQVDDAEYGRYPEYGLEAA